MLRNQIINLYVVNGLDDFQLRNTDDLLKVHGIKYDKIDGYNELDEANQTIYKNFIIKFINNLSIDNKATLIPSGIYYVEDFQYLIKENPDDDHVMVSGGAVFQILKDGSKHLLHEWADEDYKNYESIKAKSKFYLRFEYEIQERNEWIHVIKDGNEWY
ncbi:MAG: hypothetical protein AB7V16_12955 [Vulcanibacillus sp.]